jgi:glycosyltransferase involved in cell wall biosynthesis
MFFIIFYLNYYFLFSYNYIYPSISIIVPIYNVNKYLEQCLNSLIFPTLKNIEIICVNDDSNDNSLEIITQFASDKRIIILNKTNTGYGDSSKIKKN